METLFLATDADLSQASLEAAIDLLKTKGDIGLLLIAQEEELSPLSDWLWDAHRGITLVALPPFLLEHRSRWALKGYNYSVVGGRF